MGETRNGQIAALERAVEPMAVDTLGTQLRETPIRGATSAGYGRSIAADLHGAAGR
jgi:hypothetical protein